MPDGKIIGILTDVGTEELAHLEMIGSILYQLTRNLSAEEIARSPMAQYFTDHTTGVYPASAAGVPTDMKYIGVKGDVIADLNEDLAADGTMRKTQLAHLIFKKSLFYKAFLTKARRASLFRAAIRQRRQFTIFATITPKINEICQKFARASFSSKFNVFAKQKAIGKLCFQFAQDRQRGCLIKKATK